MAEGGAEGAGAAGGGAPASQAAAAATQVNTAACDEVQPPMPPPPAATGESRPSTPRRCRRQQSEHIAAQLDEHRQLQRDIVVLHRQRSRRRLASKGGGGSESGGSDSGRSGSSGSSSSGAEGDSSDSSAPGTHTPHASTSDDEEEAASAPSIVIGHEVPRELGEVVVRRKARLSERARSSGSSSCSVGASSEGSEGGEAGNATTPTGHAGADVRDDGGEDGHETACDDDDQAETEEAKNKAPRKASQRGIELYFKVWTTFAVVAAVLNGLNVKWTHLSAWSIPLAVILFIVQCALQWSACEIPLISFATLLVTPPEDEKADGSKLTVAINYNLLASDKLEVEACLGNAYEAYIGNLAPTVSSILVSATGDPDLKNYEMEYRDRCREQIRELVMTEGAAVCAGGEAAEAVDVGRRKRLYEPELAAGAALEDIAERAALDFMVVQRVTRVLRKCGQYQDLMILSERSNVTYTYCDPKQYNEAAREGGGPMFHPSADVSRVEGRRIDYVLVLDGDTGVVKDSLAELMSVAAANPDRAIVQPAIKLFANPDQPLFMHIDAMRQDLCEPISAALTTLLGRSGFFGKGLINSRLYIDKLLGTPDKLIEQVPIDVLSHDTFEAAATGPLYVKGVHLLEEPCGNYTTWDIRECRWNRGELVLSHYFFPETAGVWFTRAMNYVRPLMGKKKPPVLHLRTETHLDEPGAYIAHSALRQMLLKPSLLLYIVLQTMVPNLLWYPWQPICIVMFMLLVLPKFAIARWGNLHLLVLDTICSILQFTPEPIMGTLRGYNSCYAHITGVSGWVPQFKVEQEFASCNALLASFRFLWKVCLVGTVSSVCVIIFLPSSWLMLITLGSTALLPFYCAITAVSPDDYAALGQQAAELPGRMVQLFIAGVKRLANTCYSGGSDVELAA